MKRLVTIAALIVAFAGTGLTQTRRLEPVEANGRLTYFIKDGAPDSGYRSGDRELAVWALKAWERSANGAISLVESSEPDALILINFVGARGGAYGEMRSIAVKGRRGAEVFVNPDTDSLGPDIARMAQADPLMRDAIVYLTCVHELGHALGLSHTANYDDIMYFFGFGGDIPGFFRRYRVQLKGRADIARVAGVSAGDVETLREMYR